MQVCAASCRWTQLQAAVKCHIRSSQPLSSIHARPCSWATWPQDLGLCGCSIRHALQQCTCATRPPHCTGGLTVWLVPTVCQTSIAQLTTQTPPACLAASCPRNAFAGAFYLGYGLAHIPSAFMTMQLGARWWYGGMTIAWGIVGTCAAAIQTRAGLAVQRFFLGVTEAGGLQGSGRAVLVAPFPWYCFWGAVTHYWVGTCAAMACKHGERLMSSWGRVRMRVISLDKRWCVPCPGAAPSVLGQAEHSTSGSLYPAGPVREMQAADPLVMMVAILVLLQVPCRLPFTCSVSFTPNTCESSQATPDTLWGSITSVAQSVRCPATFMPVIAVAAPRLVATCQPDSRSESVAFTHLQNGIAHGSSCALPHTACQPARLKTCCLPHTTRRRSTSAMSRQHGAGLYVTLPVTDTELLVCQWTTCTPALSPTPKSKIKVTVHAVGLIACMLFAAGQQSRSRLSHWPTWSVSCLQPLWLLASCELKQQA